MFDRARTLKGTAGHVRLTRGNASSVKKSSRIFLMPVPVTKWTAGDHRLGHDAGLSVSYQQQDLKGRSMKAKLIAIVALPAVVLASCSVMDIPQTREEFVRHPKIKKESYTVPRSVDAVVASLNKAKRCVDAEYSQTRMGGGGMVSTSRDLYYVTVGKPSRGHADLTFRWAMSNGIMQPKGGYLILVGDLDAQGPNATKVTLHHGGGREPLIKALKEWSKGKDDSCHGYNA